MQLSPGDVARIEQLKEQAASAKLYEDRCDESERAVFDFPGNSFRFRAPAARKSG